MSELKAVEMTKLNDFHKSQPALTYPGQMANNQAQGVMLGDLVNKALSSGVVKASWDFSVHGGAITPDIYIGASLPAGAIVTHMYSSVLVPVISAGVCKFELKAGSVALGSIANVTASSDVESVSVSYSIAAADCLVYLNIDTTAATAGKVDFYIRYMNP
jgi:hypothetical protein